MRTEVLAGQYLDILSPARGDHTSPTAVRIAELKSASYTVQRPLEIGAEIAGADQWTLEILRRFGSRIGIAFQLRDDVLGVFGDPAITGKPAGEDLREGKRTLLIADAFSRTRDQHDHEAIDLLQHLLGNPELDDTHVDQARETLNRLGALDAVERQITELTTTAIATLHESGLPEPANTQLTKLADAATNRDH